MTSNSVTFLVIRPHSDRKRHLTQDVVFLERLPVDHPEWPIPVLPGSLD